jgi:DNA-binding NtrC family response regulator
VLERAIALCTGPVIAVSDLPQEISNDYRDVLPVLPGRDDSLRAWSSRYVRLVLERCDGNKRRACEVLDISYHTLQAHLDYRMGGASFRAVEGLACSSLVLDMAPASSA